MAHCPGLSGKALNDCWERDLLKQIKETDDRETICQAYLSLAEFYIDEKREKATESIYEDLKSSKHGTKCKGYAETAYNAYAALRPGRKAPHFRAMDSNNQVIDTKLIRDRAVILFFWASWCGACKLDYADMSEINKKHAEKVQVIGISGDSNRDEFNRSIQGKALRWPNIQDGDNYDGPINRVFFVNRYPTIIVIDRNGQVLTDRLRGESLIKLVQRL